VISENCTDEHATVTVKSASVPVNPERLCVAGPALQLVANAPAEF
jgi:hypothetical protein